MTCHEIPWIDYLESRLTPDRSAEVEAHLRGCRPCGREEARWRRLVAEAACVAEPCRMGCPDPGTLAAAGQPGTPPWVSEHARDCPACAEELRAVAVAEPTGVPARAPLPEALIRLLEQSQPGPLGRLADEVLSLVRSRLGDRHPMLERWREAASALAAGLAAPQPEVGPSFAAPEAEARRPDPLPVEVQVSAGNVEVEVSLQGAWIRTAVRRGGVPLAGARVRAEDELGEVTETETDQRGEALLRDDLPGSRRISVRAPGDAPRAGRG